MPMRYTFKIGHIPPIKRKKSGEEKHLYQYLLKYSLN